MKLIPTFGLRWNNGVLEQRFVKFDGTTEVWEAVPSIPPAPVNPPTSTNATKQS